MNHQIGDGLQRDRKIFEAIRKELEKKKTMRKMKAEMRAEVLKVVRFGDRSPINEAPSDNLKSPIYVLNQLILDYFEWMGFYLSANMLASEVGLIRKEKRKTLEEKLKLGEKLNKELPLIFSIMQQFLKK
jgi:hypothetical protein